MRTDSAEANHNRVMDAIGDSNSYVPTREDVQKVVSLLEQNMTREEARAQALLAVLSKLAFSMKKAADAFEKVTRYNKQATISIEKLAKALQESNRKK